MVCLWSIDIETLPRVLFALLLKVFSRRSEQIESWL
jgi:hypothetical protein